ncbi:MAG: hypothetical protein DRJ65_15290 [Acidobacteria bacterium]|nr:MAG: hypothetical protein DRJ65_15290 [Acidobacteriota bacterium]
MKFDTDKKLAGLDLEALQTMESEAKKYLVKIKRAKLSLEKAEAKKKARAKFEEAKKALKAKEEDLRKALTNMGYTKDQIKEAVRAMLQTTTKAAPKAKRNRGPSKFIYTHPKTKETYTAGKPPKWYQDMSPQKRQKIREVNPARIEWEKDQG